MTIREENFSPRAPLLRSTFALIAISTLCTGTLTTFANPSVAEGAPGSPSILGLSLNRSESPLTLRAEPAPGWRLVHEPGSWVSTLKRLSETPPQQSPPQTNSVSSPTPQSQTPNPSTPAPPPRPGLNIVVLDPAHGGTDTGARGTGGIRESEIVLQFSAQVRRALEAQGFQVVQTRLANENPSFDDRSAMANAQTGAVFVSLHVSSTGSPGTVRVYVNSDLPAAREANGLIPWDRAQAPFLGLSHKLADIVQANLTQTFRGSPGVAQASAIRQLRTTAAPAIAVEISSVSVDDRSQLDRMAPGVADAIARGVTTFRPSYVVANTSGELR